MAAINKFLDAETAGTNQFLRSRGIQAKRDNNTWLGCSKTFPAPVLHTSASGGPEG